MTSTTFMRNSVRGFFIEKSAIRALLSCGLLLMVFFGVGCQLTPALKQPITLRAPYDEPQLWGVAPFINESGVSTVDVNAVADAFAEEAQQTHGIDVVPVNRVIRAMRQHDIGRVETPAQARQVLDTLSLDGLLLGTVSGYDPYRPLRFGAAVELYTAEGDTARKQPIDPRNISRSPTDNVFLGGVEDVKPVAQAAGVFDGANHDTLKAIGQYATGRAEPDSPYGGDIYLVRMDLYVRFAAYRLLDELLASERARLRRPVAQSPTP